MKKHKVVRRTITTDRKLRANGRRRMEHGGTFPPVGDKRWSPSFDLAGLSVVVFLLLVLAIVHLAVPLTPLFVPPNDSLSNFPFPATSTISSAMCFILVILVNSAVILPTYSLGPRYPDHIRRFNLASAVWTSSSSVLLTVLVTEILKNAVGRARPDIYTRCGHNATYNKCAAAIGKAAADEFKSWPSGHASVSMSGFLHAFLFSQKVIRAEGLWVSVAWSAILVAALWIGATRIRDFRHHTDDVLAGFFVGFLFTWIIWTRNYKRIFWRAPVATQRLDDGLA
jgi:phosphatidate phosphatase